MPFEVSNTSLDAVKLLKRRVLADNRGSFARLFDAEELTAIGWTVPIAQVNHSVTKRRGSLRGMHYQLPPHADMKLVTCVRGAVLDVAVDLRAGSSTLFRHHAEILSAENASAMFIPVGFAHGFQALTDDVELIYCHSSAYIAASDAAHNVMDPMLAIPWPETVTDMSDRDRTHSLIPSSFEGVVF